MAESDRWRVIVEDAKSEAEEKGLEVYPFKVGWYNDTVLPAFKLCFPDDTLALVVISAPAMFQRLFLPFLSSPSYQPGKMDPIDQCHKEFLSKMAENFSASGDVEILQDFELDATRKPRILVQTAGHVAGASYYYQRRDVTPDAWSEDKKIYGVSIHPRYGGWFALRGVLIFKSIMATGLPRVDPPDCVALREKRVELLEKFNFHWRDWSYRDVIDNEGGVAERYSEDQKEYFGTEPQKREHIIAKLRSGRGFDS